MQQSSFLKVCEKNIFVNYTHTLSWVISGTESSCDSVITSNSSIRVIGSVCLPAKSIWIVKSCLENIRLRVMKYPVNMGRWAFQVDLLITLV